LILQGHKPVRQREMGLVYSFLVINVVRVVNVVRVLKS